VAWRWFSHIWPMSWWRWTCSTRCSFILPRPSGLWAEETFLLLFYNFFEDFLTARPFSLQQVNSHLPVHNFLAHQNARLFLFFLSIWIYLWLAETSQQPISQKPGWRSPPTQVTPHNCNHCNHKAFTSILQFFWLPFWVPRDLHQLSYEYLNVWQGRSTL
jgi:hypothetical protein